MERKIDLKSIVVEIGHVGRAQNFYFALICFTSFFSGSTLMSYVFTAGDLNYRCYIDGCDKSDSQSSDYNPRWIEYAVPFDEDRGLPEKCSVYQFIGDRNQSRDLCDANNFDDTSTIECNKFVFETEERTILTEFGVTCSENKWKLTLPGTIHGSGKFVNMLLAGYFSDRFGRKKVYISSVLLGSTFAIAQTISPNYWWYLVFVFFETSLGASVYATGLVLGLELVNPEYRTMVGSVVFAMSSTGTIYFGLTAMWVLNWKKLILLCSIPNFIVVTYIWLLPESITWLQVKGRYQDIANILLRIIKWNKIKVSAEVRDILVNRPEKMFDSYIKSDEECKNIKTIPIRDVVRSRAMMLRMLCLVYCWLATMSVFYGLSLISVTIGGNKFTDFIITCAIEIPACAFVMLVSNRIGRKIILCTAFFVSGTVLITYTLVSQIYWLKMVLFMAGKFGITTSYCTIFIYTSEMVPTNLRLSVVGLCIAFGRLGSMIAPQTPLLDALVKHLSIYVFAGLALCGGLIALRFPNTMNCKLPDTIEEALQIGKRQQNKSDVT